MKILDFLQGKWLGHPVHPALVHLPVGLWTVACALDIAVYAGADVIGAGRLALFCVGLGLLGALGSVPTGLADWWSIKKGKPAWKLGMIHLLPNLASAILWAVNLGLRLRAPAGEGSARAFSARRSPAPSCSSPVRTSVRCSCSTTV